MEIKYVNICTLAANSDDESIFVTLGLGNITGFCSNNDNLFFINNKESTEKIKELFPQFCDAIISNSEDFSLWLSYFDGGEYYNASSDLQIPIERCIDILIDKIEENDSDVISELNKSFNQDWDIYEIIQSLIKKQIADVIECSIIDLQSQADDIRNKLESIEWR